MRRTTTRQCDQCLMRPVRTRRGARYCSPCIAKKPKKTCSGCGKDFQLDMLTGPRCRPCASSKAHSKRIQDTYGITGEQYAELLVFQGGVCYICHRKPGAKRLAVDHRHSDGRTRGLLCRNCNRDVLGHLRDDVEALQRAIDYLTLTPAERLWGDDAPVAPTP